MLRALPRFTDQGRPFLAFVYGIAARKVADACRAASRDRDGERGRRARHASTPRRDRSPGPSPPTWASSLSGLLAQLPAHAPGDPGAAGWRSA